MDAIDHLQELRELNERIICTATFYVQCRECQHRNKVNLVVPVNPQLYLEDHVMRESLLNARFSPSTCKAFAEDLGCPACSAHDFEVGEVTRLPAYLDGDPMRLPVDLE
jgi:hypothetical protein